MSKLVKKLASGLGLGLVTIGIVLNLYIVGKNDGIKIGRIKEREKTIMLLVDEKYDLRQNAKFAKSLSEQDSILNDIGIIDRTFNILDRRGYFDNISSEVTKSAFPNDYQH